MKRRDFLKTTATAAFSSIVVPLVLIGEELAESATDAKADMLPYVDDLGLQLWTVRNQMDVDKATTLEAIAEAGYCQIELGAILNQGPIFEIAKDLGLKVNSGFMNWEAIVRMGDQDVPEVSRILEEANKRGVKHLVFGYIAKGFRETETQMKQIAENSNKAAELAKKAGIQMCYHNHSFEFAPITTGQEKTAGFEIFVSEFDKDLMKFELDVFWAKIGGLDPLETMQRLSGRISQIHLKDLKAGTATNFDEGTVAQDAFQELGDGTIDMKKVLNLAKEIGVAHCHVEQDQSPNPLASIKQSIDFIRA